MAENKLKSYKSWKINQAEEEAKEYRKQARRSNFRHLMLDYYKDQKTYDEAKKEILGNHDEDSRRAKNDNQIKTLKKIKAKKETKSHNLQKILNLIDDDIERGYGDRANITDEQQKHANDIEKSHGFITRW